MTLFNQVKLSVCLVLDKRIDKWFPLRDKIQEIGFSCIPFICGEGKLLDPEVYSHVDIKAVAPKYEQSLMYPSWFTPQAYNCWLCHRHIMLTFLKNFNDGYLFMLEDDAQIEPDFHEILIKCEDDINTINPDMLYLGAFHRPESWSPTDNPNLLKVNWSAGWHAVMMSHKVVSELVQFDPLGPFDWISQHMHKKYNCLAIYPSIITQADGFSFIESAPQNKPSRYDR